MIKFIALLRLVASFFCHVDSDSARYSGEQLDKMRDLKAVVEADNRDMKAAWGEPACPQSAVMSCLTKIAAVALCLERRQACCKSQGKLPACPLVCALGETGLAALAAWDHVAHRSIFLV